MEPEAPSVYADAFQTMAVAQRRTLRRRRVLIGCTLVVLVLGAGVFGPLWWHIRQLDERRAWERELGQYVWLYYTPTDWSYRVFSSEWVPSSVGAWYQEKSKQVSAMDFSRLAGRNLPPELAEKLIHGSWPHLRNLANIDGACWDGHRWVLPRDSGPVSFINLAGISLHDQALSRFPHYPRLRVLDLSQNPLGDAVADYVGRLTELERLVLNNTQVTDRTLAALAGCAQLVTLELRHTAVQGKGLAHLGVLSQLKFLDLRQSPVIDEHLRHLPPLPALTTLDLSGTKIEGGGLAWQGTPALEVLNLGDTPLRPEHLAHLKRFQALRSLTLSGTVVQGPGLEQLQDLPKLSEINLSRTAIDDRGVQCFTTGSWPSLRELVLAGTPITDAAAKPLRQLARLRGLTVSDSQVGDAFVAALAGHPALTSLSLRNTLITDACVPSLQSLSALTFLDVRGTKFTEAAAAAFLARGVYFASDRPPGPPF